MVNESKEEEEIKDQVKDEGKEAKKLKPMKRSLHKVKGILPPMGHNLLQPNGSTTHGLKIVLPSHLLILRAALFICQSHLSHLNKLKKRVIPSPSPQNQGSKGVGFRSPRDVVRLGPSGVVGLQQR